MLQIINSKKKLNKLKFISDLILIEIPYKLNLHNCINKISLLYIYQISSQNEFIIIFNHSEINSTLKIKDLDFIFTSAHKKYVLDKKNFLYITSNIKNLIDIKLLYYLNTNKELSLSKYITSAHNFLNYKYPNYDKINTIIPVYKHYEFCSKVKNRILRILKSNSEHNEFYNNLMINNFYKIEKNGLYVDKKLFESKFGYSSRKYIDKNNLVYSNYNLLTTTGRPSNRFGGINYAALNKKDCTRKVFKSRFIKNGLLLEFDFESYHLRLIADLIGYTFPKNIPAHTYMAKKYFNIKNPNDEQIKESKSISFQMLYGNIDKKYKNIQFLKKTEQFIDNLWSEYKRRNFIKLPLSYRKVKDTDNKNKLFNYYIQGYETERNAIVIYDLLQLLKEYKTKLILYTYDAFLFDFCFDDKKELIIKIKNILVDKYKFPVRIKYGINYKDLKNINIKF